MAVPGRGGERQAPKTKWPGGQDKPGLCQRAREMSAGIREQPASRAEGSDGAGHRGLRPPGSAWHGPAKTLHPGHRVDLWRLGGTCRGHHGAACAR